MLKTVQQNKLIPSSYLWLFTICAVLPQPAIADSQNLLEEIVVSASRNPQQHREVASNITRLDARELQQINHTHINETMHRIPGAWISRGNGQEHLTALRSPVLTGAGGCGAFLMAQDSISLRATGFCNVNELFEGNSEQAGAIEVIKGPGPVLYGSNALHGVINLLSPELVQKRKLSIEAGPDQYSRASLSLGDSSRRLDINGVTDDGYKDDSGFDQQKGTFQLHHKIGAAEVTSRVSFSNLNQETAGFIQGFEAYKDDLKKQTNPNPEAYRDARSVRAHSRILLPTDGGELVLTPYFRSVNMTFLQHFLPGQALEKNYHRSLGFQSAWHHADNNGGNWVVGLDSEVTQGHLTEFQPGPITTSAFLATIIPPGLHYDYDVDAVVSGLFAQRSQEITPRLRTIAGVRWERSHYDYDNLMQDGRTQADGTPCPNTCRFNRPADRADSFSNVSPKLGIIFDLNDSQQIYSQIARGFRAPQTTELYRLQNTQSVSQIDSEEIDSIEIGYRAGFENMALELAVFSMHKDNFIFRDTTRTNVDNGKTVHRGLEFSWAYQPAPNLTVKASGTFARHQYDNNPTLASTAIKGNDIDTAPRHMGAVQFSWQVTGQLATELEWTHLGSYFEDPENLHPYEGHDLFHLRAHLNLRTWSISMRLMNLLDEDYAERADFGFGQDRYFVGTPRSLYVSISRDF